MSAFSERPYAAAASGFTMIELLMAMTIMAVLGIFAALMIPNIQDRAQRAQTEATMHLYQVALDEYRRDFGDYPDGDIETVQNILTQRQMGGWSRAGEHWFDGRSDLDDAWGRPFSYRVWYEYEVPETGYDIGPGVERTPGMNDFYNPRSFQMYSTGPNMRTWPSRIQDGGHPRLPGTQPNDIRNWEHEEFYTPADYEGIVFE